MPTPTTTDLPIPKSWDEFEDISADLLKRMWRDPYVTRNGRSGQSQFGVDIYGRPVHLREKGTQIAVAQCRRVESLTEQQISDELKKAYNFNPLPEEYLMLTTLKRDSTLQTFVRKNTWKINRVEILFWDDICLYLAEFDELLKKHFPCWFRSSTSKNDLVQFLIESIPDDFEYDDLIGQHLHRSDVSLRLRLNRSEEKQRFQEAWVKNFPDQQAYEQKVYLEYNGSRIETFWFVYVDGFRYLIPYPKSATDLRISPFQYHLASILNSKIPGYGVDFGLQNSGITVDPEMGK
jgi:hypothetical protein